MKLYLVDSSIFIFKAWYAQKVRCLSRDGEQNQAFIGFSDFVYRLLTEVAPRKLVFAFDSSLARSARREIYPQYKANRAPAPAELRRQFDWCRRWVELLGISQVASPFWEADDLIGSLAARHRSERLSIVILSADKDLTQLIGEYDVWWSFYDDRRLDYRAIRKKFGVAPEQIADQLALTGDKVDNIPGIPMVGRKTAANLLRRFGDLETLRNNLDQVAGMKFRYAGLVARSLMEHESLLDMTSQLTRINCELSEVEGIGIDRGAIQRDQVRRMMSEQNMDAGRRQKWDQLMESS